MPEPVAPRRQKIDLEAWERRAFFEVFSTFTEPYTGVCVRVDCTATYNYAKEHGLSVSLSLLHRSLAAAHQIENFRTRIVDGAVWRYEDMLGGAVVDRPNGTIAYSYLRYIEPIEDFVREASAESERVRQRNDVEPYGAPNLILYSNVPWLDFTSVSHARDFSRGNSEPRITFGKITEANGRRTMPVSIDVHHALADGLHIAQYLVYFQKLLDAPESRHPSAGAPSFA